MTDEKLIEKLSDLVREAEKTFEVDENRCIIYPHKLLQKMVITRVLYARQETLEDAWYLFISDIPHADPPGKDGMDGTSQGLLSEYSEKWLEYIKKTEAGPRCISQSARNSSTRLRMERV